MLGMTPMMVLLSEVPFRSRLRTSCMLRGESTLVRMVEPGSSTPSWVSSSGRRLGIWMALPDAMAARSAPFRRRAAHTPAPPGGLGARLAPAPLRAPGRDTPRCDPHLAPAGPRGSDGSRRQGRYPGLAFAGGDTPPPPPRVGGGRGLPRPGLTGPPGLVQ